MCSWLRVWKSPGPRQQAAAANNQLAVLSGPGEILFRSSHPVCFSWAPPGQAPFRPRAMGARRDAHTPWDAHTAALTHSQTHLQKQWSFHRLGDPCWHPRAHTVHRHTYTRHTSLCLVTESGPRQEARCPRSGSPPPPPPCCNPGKLKAFQQVFSPPIFVSFPGPEEQGELFR